VDLLPHVGRSWYSMCEQVDLGNPMAMVIPWSHGDGDQALATSTPS